MINAEELISNINRDIIRYSVCGDNSLEYIGITVEDNIFTDYKLYRINKNNNSELTEIPECVREFYRSIEKKYSYLTFFDYSFRSKREEKNIYSVSFEVYKPDEFINSEEREIIKKVFCKKRDPYIQKGFIIDDVQTIIEEKFYYTLNDDNRQYTWKKRFESLISKREDVIKYIKYTLGCFENEFSKRLFDQSCDNGYRLFMMGSNVSEKYKSNKMYFIYDYKREYYEHMKKSIIIIEQLMNFNMLKEIINYLFDKRFLLKGYACELKNNNPVWRLYFWHYE